MTKEEFGAKIRSLRKEKGISALEASTGIGIHQMDLYAIERGERNVSVYKMSKILKFYGYDYQHTTKIIKNKSKIN